MGTVHTIADALGINRTEAEMAGLRPPTSARTGAVSARQAILHDRIYTDQQKKAMLELLDISTKPTVARPAFRASATASTAASIACGIRSP